MKGMVTNMAKTETLHIRVNENVKANAEETLGMLGISISEAVNMFLCQVNLTGGLPFEVIANVHIQHEATGEPHEIDLMFSIGEQVFGMEQKSGLNFSDYDHYRKIGEWLGIIPDHYLLLNSNLTEDYAVGCIQYFHRYYISSLANYQKVLKAMLEKNLTK